MLQEFTNEFMINYSFIEQVVDCMHDWVRVVDINGNVLYMNQAMENGVGEYIQGMKCYNALGRNEPCENCITKKSVFDGDIHEKEEIINNRVYSVMSSPMKDSEGRLFASVEVLRDITLMKQLQKQVKAQNRRLNKEIETAKKLQLSLLPKDFKDERLDFAYFYNPCESLSGDFINIFKIDNTHVGIYIADVSGHGVSSSMLTVFLKSTIDKKQLSPSVALTKFYKDFNEIEMCNDLYITVFSAVLDLESLELTYSNAGHSVIPFVFGENRLDLLQSAGIPICDWLPEPEYVDKIVHLRKGDSLFLYTDGLVDLRNSENVQIGEEKILNILQNTEGNASFKIKRLRKELLDYTGKGGLSTSNDDITMSILTIK